MESLVKSFSGLNLLCKFLKTRTQVVIIPNRNKFIHAHPRKRHPPWLPKQLRVPYNEELTAENRDFIKEVVESKYGEKDHLSGSTSPLKIEPIEPRQEWTPTSRRCGLIAKKIGVYPMWLKDGSRVTSTLLHICDNHVIKYIPPEEWNPMVRSKHNIPKRKLGCLIIGAESADPQKFTKEYCGMFIESGVMPTNAISRFAVSPDAAIQPGTPLYAAHYKPGDYIDIRGKTVDRGFQGVMKRWGFKGMPATHGVTKTHRRPGNIGSGGEKARVMPGTKMPGHMGNRYRIIRGVKILRINYKYNVMWVQGHNLPGETNNWITVYDTLLYHKRYTKTAPVFPTFFPGDTELPEELYADEVHQFGAPTIELEPEKEKTKKK
ncbi:39S ribosomal protein L3, mitochondrial [Chelonus insularis]|uniref:39S ribosomal protein L3, mitochondrial n=1 Tax=Chelonus insularis TaxID=460826 RepID=UPI00158E16E0|nr:39S ribosomal protein L3, mitochondrial [Chelonus insularis]